MPKFDQFLNRMLKNSVNEALDFPRKLLLKLS